MELLDRPKQLELLQFAAAHYPGYVDLDPTDPAEARTVLVNLAYLAEHKLLDCDIVTSIGGHTNFGSFKATARGMDFLANDGGLSAILGTVTVKFHDDTIRQLLLDRVDQATDTDEPTKGVLRQAIGSVSTEGLKHLTTKALDYGLGHAPGAMSWLLQAIHHLP